MPRKNEPSKKEIYRLWREYLKKSETYMRFCDWWRNKSDEERLKLFFEPSREYKEFWPVSWCRVLLGDIHSQNFEDWWESKPNRLSDPTFPPLIADVTKHIDELSQFFYDTEEDPGKKPLLSKKYNLAWVNNELSPYQGCVLRISHIGELRVEAYIKEFRNILKKYKRKIIDSRNRYPTEPFRFDEVKRYLQVYCLRTEGKKYSQIIEILYPEIEKELSKGSLPAGTVDGLLKRKASIERALHMDFNKAKKIIKNVEQGLFPGKY